MFSKQYSWQGATQTVHVVGLRFEQRWLLSSRTMVLVTDLMIPRSKFVDPGHAKSPNTATMGDEVDVLYSLRSNFFLGHYQMAIEEGKKVSRSINAGIKTERDEFVFRSMLALGDYDAVLRSIPDGSAPGTFQNTRPTQHAPS